MGYTPSLMCDARILKMIRINRTKWLQLLEESGLSINDGSSWIAPILLGFLGKGSGHVGND